MGCDIHGSLQKRWSKDSPYQTVSEIPHGRNYRLFAALADVRNDGNIVPISEARGVPADVVYDGDDSVFDEDGNRIPGSIDLGEHSFSWLSIKELIEWEGWDQIIQESWIVDRKEYERMITAGDTSPETYCGGVGGPGVVITTHEEILAGTAPANWTYTQFEWQSVLRDKCQTFMLWLEYLKAEYYFELEAKYNDENDNRLRIVFGFDS